MKKTRTPELTWDSVRSNVQDKLTHYLKDAPLDDLIRQKALSDKGVF
jgi:hypothetical protein